jgi:hypothetical protein
MPKLSVREDVEEMFAGSDLSEEFREKASEELLIEFDRDCLKYSEDGDSDNHFYSDCKYWENKLKEEEPKQGTHYHFIIQNDKYKMLLAMQTYPETKYYFKDDEISVEELILRLDNGESSEIKYSEDEVRELLIKGLTHNDDKLCGSLVTVQKEIRTANFNVWFEENKKK